MRSSSSAGRTGFTITWRSCSAPHKRSRAGEPRGAGPCEPHRTLFSAAGRHFNHGQRAFFFALGYLDGTAGPIVFLVTTAAVVIVIWRRQFVSDSLRAVADDAA